MKTVAKIATGVAALALIASGAGALLLPAGMTFAFAGVASGTIAMVAGAVSAGATLLSKKPDIPKAQTDRLYASIDPAAYRKTVLGSTAMPVDLRYTEWFGTDQERCAWIVALASHRIDGVDQIWLNDELAWTATGGTTAKFNGYLFVRAIRTEGTAANTVTFGSGRWNATRRLTGCAYAWLEFKVTGNSKKTESPFSGGVPSRVTIVGRGAPLYDPRRDSTVPGGSGPMRADDESTWRFTANDGPVIGENLALQILRVLIGGRIDGKLATGCGIALRRIDLQSFQIAANQCDEVVNRSAAGTEPRFRGAGVLSEGDDPSRQLDMMLAACCGRLTDDGGKLGLVISHNDLAEAATDDGLNEDDVIGAFTWNPDPSIEETQTVVRGRYTDPSPASLYQLVPLPDVTLAGEGAAGEVVLPLDLPWVESPSQGQRIFKQALQRRQYNRSFTAPFDIRAWKYRKGQVVPFTFAPLGFARRLFRVMEQERGDYGQCLLTLREENSAIYAWDADDRAAVQGAEPIIYDGRNNPLILAIDEAAETAVWENVTGEGRPQDGATVGAPPGTMVGDRSSEDVTSAIDENAVAIAAARALADSTKARADTLEGTTIPAINSVLADAETRIDGAEALAQAAQNRADGAHSRIDEIVVESGGGDTDTYARSRIAEIQTNFTEADTALAQEIDAVEASIGPAINAKAQEITTAYTEADTALAQRAALLEARQSGTGFLFNPRFALWPRTMPEGWLAYESFTPIKSQTAGGENVFSFNSAPGASAGITAGYLQNDRLTQMGAGWYVVEVDFEIRDGRLTGLVYRLQGFDAADAEVEAITRDFSTIADQTGTIPGSGVTNRVYSFRRLERLTSAAIARGGIFVGTFGSDSAQGKHPTFYAVNIRAATQAEIDTGVALPDLVARVGEVETATTDGRFATAQRASDIEASVGQVTGRVGLVETAVSDGRFAAASTVATLQSNYNGTAATVTQQAGTIAGLATRTAAYWQVLSVAGNNRAQLTISADANGGAGVDIVGDVSISGNLLANGTIVASKFLTDQGVDLAQAQVPGTASWTTAISSAAEFSTPLGAGGSYTSGVFGPSGVATVSPYHHWRVNMSVTVTNAGGGSSASGNSYISVYLQAYYRVGAGAWVPLGEEVTLTAGTLLSPNLTRTFNGLIGTVDFSQFGTAVDRTFPSTASNASFGYAIRLAKGSQNDHIITASSHSIRVLAIMAK